MRVTPLRFCVIGCGRVFEQFHMPAIRVSEHWDLRAVCDSDLHRRQWIGQVLPDMPTYSSVHQMLNEVELDAALIASPPTSHTMLFTQIIGRGLHVLLEKPGGHTLADATKLHELASRSSRVIWIGYNRRFNPNYRLIQEIIERTPPSEGAVFGFDLSLSVEDWASFSGYLGDENLGGGVVRDVVSHQLDLLAWMFTSPVIAVRARAWDQTRPVAERLTFDIRLESDIVIHCHAEHGTSYRESLTFEDANRSLLTFPTGVLTTGKAKMKALKRLSRPRYWFDRKLIRMGLRVDPSQLAYRDQLEGFAAAIRGKRLSTRGTSVPEGIATHRAMDALVDGWGLPGEWRTVAPDAGSR